MHAIIREATYVTDRPLQETAQFKELQSLHARQPGYAGTVGIDAGDGRLFTITMWQTASHAAAARAVLEPVVRSLLHPLMTVPSQLLGTGPVVVREVAEPAPPPD